MSTDLSGGSVPVLYRDLFEMFNLHGLDKLTLPIFITLFESNTLSKTALNQIWCTINKSNAIHSRSDFYKCLALMGLVQQGKAIDEKFLDNYTNKELPTPILDSVNNLEDRLIHILRSDKKKTTLCFRYNDLCSLDTIQIELIPDKRGPILKHVEYDVTSMRLKDKVSRRYNDFVALHELLISKYPYRIIPALPPKKILTDKEFIEERRKALQRYLQILCRHPIICESEIIKFFLTFKGKTCGDNMKATYKNTQEEFHADPQISAKSIDANERLGEDADGIEMFHSSQAHISFLHEYFNLIRGYLKSINEKKQRNANDFINIGNTLQTIGSDSTIIDRWATGPNDYWPTIQVGLEELPTEINAVSERIIDQYKRDEVITDDLDMLIQLLQSYKDLCVRFEEALQIEQKLTQKAANQQKRVSQIADASPKNDINLELIQKRNKHALQCVKIETQLIYANLEAFVYILSTLGNSQHKGSCDLLDIWKSFTNKISQLGQAYIAKSPTSRANAAVRRK